MHMSHVPEDSLVCLSTVFTPGEENCPREGEQIKIQFRLYQINVLISGRMVEIYWYSHNSLVDFMGQLIKNILMRAMHIISRAPVFYQRGSVEMCDLHTVCRGLPQHGQHKHKCSKGNSPLESRHNACLACGEMTT